MAGPRQCWQPPVALRQTACPTSDASSLKPLRPVGLAALCTTGGEPDQALRVAVEAPSDLAAKHDELLRPLDDLPFDTDGFARDADPGSFDYFCPLFVRAERAGRFAGKC